MVIKLTMFKRVICKADMDEHNPCTTRTFDTMKGLATYLQTVDLNRYHNMIISSPKANTEHWKRTGDVTPDNNEGEQRQW